MATDLVVEFTDDNFEADVLKSDVPVLVDFWAEWCMPCRMLAPTIDQVADEFSGKVKVGKLSEIGANVVVLKNVPESSVVMPPASTVFRGMAFNKRDFDTGETQEAELEKQS